MGQQIRLKYGVAVAIIAVVAAAFPMRDAAAASPTVVPNLSESRGCEPGVAGPRRPFVSSTGTMSQSEMIRGPWGAMFGRTYSQVSASLVWWRIPGTSRSIRVHERLLPALDRAAANLSAHILDGGYYRVYSAFAWVWRTVGGRFQVSEHAMGSAFDINPRTNPYREDNRLISDMPSWFIDAFVDAGFCWGGDWIDVKDPMHFSWSGPIATPDYPARPAPYPPVTTATGFRGDVARFRSAVAANRSTGFAVADFTGDGAPDIIQVTDSGRVLGAGAVGGYNTLALRLDDVGGGPDSLIGDYDGDGRPDIWAADRSGPTIRFVIHTWADAYAPGATITTAIPSDADRMLTGLYDDDFVPDIYVVRSDGVDVYRSGVGFAGAATLPLPNGVDSSWVFATGDHDADGKTDVYALLAGPSPSVRVALAAGSSMTYALGEPVDPDASFGVGDYDGDGRDDLFILEQNDLSVFFGGAMDLARDAWFVSSASMPVDAGPECLGTCDSIGYVDERGVWFEKPEPSAMSTAVDFYYGNPGDAPFAGDWNCDGIDTPGLYRRSDGYVYLRETNTQGVADRSFYFGDPGDVPLVGDFDGDGCDTVGVFRPSAHRVFIINELGADGAGLGAADFSFVFGNPGDVAFTGDFDGDGADEVGLHRPSTGTVFLKWNLTGGIADTSFVFGKGGDVLVAGDWNGDGVDTPAVYRPSEGTWYLKLVNGPGNADHIIHFHSHEDVTLPFAGRFGL